MHIQYPEGKKAQDSDLDSKGGALSGNHDDRKEVRSAARHSVAA